MARKSFQLSHSGRVIVAVQEAKWAGTATRPSDGLGAITEPQLIKWAKVIDSGMGNNGRTQRLYGAIWNFGKLELCI